MDPVDYLRLIRRRWYLLVVPIVLGLVAAYVTTPKQQQFASVRSFTATHTLLEGADVTNPPNFDRVTLFATTPPSAWAPPCPVRSWPRGCRCWPIPRWAR